MRKEKNILIAFILNLVFSIFEFIGGVFTNSVAIMSDSIHDIGDSLSIGISYFLEKKSKRKIDEEYTYGYIRYSVIGGLITTVILLLGSLLVIYSAIKRLINPIPVNYNGMFIFAIIGVLVNFLAAYFTSGNNSLNEKAVNLHMLEDCLGWGLTLIGSIVIKFTDILIIDPVLSILVALFIFKNAFSNFMSIIDLFLEKTPKKISIKQIKQKLLNITDIVDIHHIHVWSIDGYNNCATMHVVTNKPSFELKRIIRIELQKIGIDHVTIELEKKYEVCDDKLCKFDNIKKHCHGHDH